MLMAMMINKAEKLFNHYLNRDSEKAQLLYQKSGKVLRVEISSIASVTMKICADHVELTTSNLVDADVTVSGNPLALMQMLFSDSVTLPKNVTIAGDVALAQEIKSALKEIDVDWEEYVSQFLGDPLAHFLGNRFRGVKKWQKKAKQSMKRSLHDYIHEETRCVVGKEEVDPFLQEVDELKHSVERLQARIERLAL